MDEPFEIHPEGVLGTLPADADSPDKVHDYLWRWMARDLATGRYQTSYEPANGDTTNSGGAYYIQRYSRVTLARLFLLKFSQTAAFKGLFVLARARPPCAVHAPVFVGRCRPAKSVGGQLGASIGYDVQGARGRAR